MEKVIWSTLAGKHKWISKHIFGCVGVSQTSPLRPVATCDALCTGVCLFACLSLRWHSAVSSGQKPFPGKRPALYAVYGSVDVIKSDIKKQPQQKAHILTNNTANMEAPMLSQVKQQVKEQRLRRPQVYSGDQGCSARTLQSHTHESIVCYWKWRKIPPCSNKSAHRKWKSKENTGGRAGAYLRLRLLLIL